MLNQRIPLSWALPHCVGTVQLGLSTEAMLKQSLIDPAFGDDRDTISFEQFGLLVLNTARLVEDEAAGCGKFAISMGLSNVAAHTMLGCSTLEYALALLEKLYRHAPVHYSVVLEGEEALIAVYVDQASNEALAYVLEDRFSIFLFGLISYFLGRPTPARAHQTRDPTHPNLNGRHWATFAPVRLAGAAGLRVPRSVLGARRVGEGTDTLYWDMIGPWVALAEQHLQLAETQFVQLGNLRLDVLAAGAGVSVSTLRRQMTRTQGGFRMVRQRLVVDASVQLLCGSSRSMEAIAAELGYSDARSFRRFIKSATGKTPEALRSTASAAAPSSASVRERLREVSMMMRG